MEPRVNISQTEPEAYKAMIAMEKYLTTTQLKPLHKELIRIRASQINGCAYCLNLHTRDARKIGETEQRLYILSAWKEVPSLFTKEEQAIFALTEEVTLINHGGVSEETYQMALKLFDERYIAQVIIAVIIINSWNRIAISTHMKPE